MTLDRGFIGGHFPGSGDMTPGSSGCSWRNGLDPGRLGGQGTVHASASPRIVACEVPPDLFRGSVVGWHLFLRSVSGWGVPIPPLDRGPDYRTGLVRRPPVPGPSGLRSPTSHRERPAPAAGRGPPTPFISPAPLPTYLGKAVPYGFLRRGRSDGVPCHFPVAMHRPDARASPSRVPVALPGCPHSGASLAPGRHGRFFGCASGLG